MAGVEGELGAAVVGEDAVGDLDQETDVGGCGVTAGVEVRARAQQHQVGLRLVERIEAQRALNAGDDTRGSGTSPTGSVGITM